MKMYGNTNQLPALTFGGPNQKPHGARGLIKHYHLHFYPKIGNDMCEILCITCTCVACTSMIDQPCIFVLSSKNKHTTNL